MGWILCNNNNNNNIDNTRMHQQPYLLIDIIISRRDPTRG
jgi:hypothetical protein